MDMQVHIDGYSFERGKAKGEFHKTILVDCQLPGHQIVRHVFDLYEGGGREVHQVAYQRQGKRCSRGRKRLEKLNQYGRSFPGFDNHPPETTVVCDTVEVVEESYPVPGAFDQSEEEGSVYEDQRPRQHDVGRAQTHPAEQYTNRQMHLEPGHRRQAHATSSHTSNPSLVPNHRPPRQRHSGLSASPTYGEAPRYRPYSDTGHRRSGQAIGQRDDVGDPLRALPHQQARRRRETRTNDRREDMPDMWDQEVPSATSQRRPGGYHGPPSSVPVQPARSQYGQRLHRRASTLTNVSSSDMASSDLWTYGDLRSPSVVSLVQAHAASQIGSQNSTRSGRPGFFDFLWRLV